jgi:hypothetical protein
MMRTAAFCLALLVCGAGIAQKKKKAPPPKPADELTGCVDEQAGPQYVLRDEGMKLLALLQPDGFDVEQFAQYMGEKVTVIGQLAQGEPSTFRVKSIRRVAPSCKAPDGEQQRRPPPAPG